MVGSTYTGHLLFDGFQVTLFTVLVVQHFKLMLFLKILSNYYRIVAYSRNQYGATCNELILLPNSNYTGY